MTRSDEWRANLFVTGRFTSSSGIHLPWKIECDALTDADIETLAHLIAASVSFGSVEGVPRGGLRLAAALEPYAKGEGPLLIVDDVLTTGQSMERQRAGREAIGIVLFDRTGGADLGWIRAVWSLSL